MVRKDIHKNLRKAMGKYPIVKDDTEIEKVQKIIDKEALRKKGKRKGKKKDCGCDS